MELFAGAALYHYVSEDRRDAGRAWIVGHERRGGGGDAYSIAANYLGKTGAMSDTFVTNDRLLQIVVTMFRRGEFNKIRLANKAIAQFEAELV